MKSDEFGLYLLRELLWELSKFGVSVAGLTNIPPEQIEVVSYESYDRIRLRVAETVFEAHLNWSSNAPPIVERVTHL